MVWSAVVGAASSLLGGALNSQSASNVNSQAADQAANNLAKQEEFAQKGIRWRARDIMEAYKETGIHPLALLGVQGASYSPVTTAFTPSGMGDSVARAGQDIGRAINANADRGLRREQLELQRQQMNSLTERGVLENELLRTRIASEQQRMSQTLNPPVPASNVVGPSWQYVKTPSGWMLLKSKAAQERLEDDFIGTTIWNASHRAYTPPPPMGVKVPAGMKLVWRRGSQEWQMKPLSWEDPELVVPRGQSSPKVLGPNDLWRRGRHPSQR